jgi:hypothetical protein
MRCRECAERIFFFRCSHGSRVLFDELGPPWPQHDCDRRWAETRRRSVDEQGRVHVEVAAEVTVTQLPDDFDIADDVIDLARRASQAESRSRRRADDIVRQAPTPTADDFYVGTLREVRAAVDPLRHYRVQDSAMARAGLRDLGRQDVGRITVHVLFGEDIESYTAWIPTAILEDSEVSRGATVEVQLVGLRILAPEPIVVWYSPSLEVLFA